MPRGFLVLLFAWPLHARETSEQDCAAERVSLLQSHAHQASPQKLRSDPAVVSGPQVLLDKVRTLAHRRFNGTVGDEDVQALLDGVSAALTTFSGTTVQEYEGLQASINTALAAVHERAGDAEQLDASEVADLEPRVEATRATNEECQTRLSGARRSETERCSVLQSHVDSQLSSCNPALQHGCDSSEDFWAVYDYWRNFIEMQGATIASQRTACDDAQTAVLTQTAECTAAEEEFTAAQSNLESHNLRCETYDAVVGNLHEVLDGANSQVTFLQRDHSTIALTRCIFNIIASHLQGTEPERTIESCEADESYADAAQAALPVFAVDIPGSAACDRTAQQGSAGSLQASCASPLAIHSSGIENEYSMCGSSQYPDFSEWGFDTSRTCYSGHDSIGWAGQVVRDPSTTRCKVTMGVASWGYPTDHLCVAIHRGNWRPELFRTRGDRILTWFQNMGSADYSECGAADWGCKIRAQAAAGGLDLDMIQCAPPRDQYPPGGEAVGVLETEWFPCSAGDVLMVSEWHTVGGAFLAAEEC